VDTAQLELTHFLPLVKTFLNNPSSDIRIEAQAAYIILNKAHSFDFLADVKEPIQDWHQLVLMDLICKIHPKELPHFSTWLNSKNKSVIELCLKLIRHFQQFDAIEKVIHLLKHPDNEIKLHCIQILGEFEVSSAEPALLDCYNSQTVELQAPILKVLGRINSGNQLQFLLKAAAAPQFEIAYEASAALLAHGAKGIDLLKHYHQQAEPMNLQIIDQLLGETNNKNHGVLA
jgi:HEAT repeat protein